MSERLAEHLASIARGVIYGLALSALALIPPPRRDGGGDGGRGPDDDAPVSPIPPDADAQLVVVPDFIPAEWPAREALS